MPRPNTVEKFWSLVDQAAGDSECWSWTRPLRPNGYGQFRFALPGEPPRNWLTHRLAYVLSGEVIPSGLVLDHLCRNRACCNPAHLEPVTNGENVLRGTGVTAVNASATHCAHGHEFTESNTRVTAKGERSCKTCARARNRALTAERAQRIAVDPSLAEHGKTTTYSSWGCRCAECRHAWSTYMRAYHQRRTAA